MYCKKSLKNGKMEIKFKIIRDILFHLVEWNYMYLWRNWRGKTELQNGARLFSASSSYFLSKYERNNFSSSSPLKNYRLFHYWKVHCKELIKLDRRTWIDMVSIKTWKMHGNFPRVKTICCGCLIAAAPCSQFLGHFYCFPPVFTFDSQANRISYYLVLEFVHDGDFLKPITK